MPKSLENPFVIDNVSYTVKKPTAKDQNLAQLEYNRVYGDALRTGAPLRKALYEHASKQGLWSEEKAKEIIELSEQIEENHNILKKGGIKFSKAREVALTMRGLRFKLTNLLVERSNLDSGTAEAQAENAKFQRLLTLCLVYTEEGNPVYKNIDELLENDNNPVARMGFDVLGEIVYNIDNEYEYNLPENKFLREWGQIDEELRLIDKDGNLINHEGKRIDEKGRLLNEQGQPVDSKGRLIDDNGDLVVEASPFLDDDGNPIEPPKKG